jgi:hypothetical protein
MRREDRAIYRSGMRTGIKIIYADARFRRFRIGLAYLGIYVSGVRAYLSRRMPRRIPEPAPLSADQAALIASLAAMQSGAREAEPGGKQV